VATRGITVAIQNSRYYDSTYVTLRIQIRKRIGHPKVKDEVSEIHDLQCQVAPEIQQKYLSSKSSDLSPRISDLSPELHIHHLKSQVQHLKFRFII